MANSRSSGEFKEYATIDTLPDSVDTGYFTNPVSIRVLQTKFKIQKIFFSIRELEADPSEASAASVVTVTLQYRCDGDADWTDYVILGGTALAIGNRFAIEDTGAGVYWRAGVKPDDFTSGQIIFGFDW